MVFKVNKEEFLRKFALAVRFSSNKLSSLPILQGIFLRGEKNRLHLYSSNLNSFFHTVIKTEIDKDDEFIIEAKKVVEFINLLPEGKLKIEKKEKEINIETEKVKGAFPLLEGSDFPLPPKMEEKKIEINPDFFTKNLPLILFSASSDEARPALSGINLVTDDAFLMVATDGFRLSLVKTNKKYNLPSIIIPSGFLKEILTLAKEEKEIDFFYSQKEKIILFKIGEYEFFSRLIEGEFPPFEKVIPQEKKTVIIVDKEELLRDIKLASIFARDLSNIVVFETKEKTMTIKPKTGEDKNTTTLDIELEGEEQKVAFNYKYLLDFLNNIDAKKITIEILRSDAPVVFKVRELEGFLHIIMPVRIQE